MGNKVGCPDQNAVPIRFSTPWLFASAFALCAMVSACGHTAQGDDPATHRGGADTIIAQGDDGVMDSNSLPVHGATQGASGTARPVGKDSAEYARIQSFNEQPDPLLDSLKRQAQELRGDKGKRP